MPLPGSDSNPAPAAPQPPLPEWKTPPPADGRTEYSLHTAQGEHEVKLAQALRFEVFNLELNEGLQTSYASGLDADAFDPVCDHLIVRETQTGAVVGTYRLQTGVRAAQNLGYYSAIEFDFLPFESMRSQMVELGRACVHKNHRNLTVIQLLWKGIATYAIARGARYLVGCSSLTSQAPADGADAYRQLAAHLAPPEWRTVPVASCACPMDALPASPVKIPKLLLAYLSLGARICGPPAIDREFKTIDFLTFLDIQSLPRKAVAKYFGG